MDYKEIVKKIKKYPEKIIENEDKALFRCRSYGDYYSNTGIMQGGGKIACYALLYYNGKTWALCHDPYGCRESFGRRTFHPHYYNVRKTKLALKEDFVLLYVYLKNGNGFADTVKSINKAEAECKINKTKLISKDSQNHILIVPSEWFYNNILLSAYLLYMRKRKNDGARFFKKMVVLMKHRKYIFPPKSNAEFRTGGFGVDSFLEDAYEYEYDDFDDGDIYSHLDVSVNKSEYDLAIERYKEKLNETR
jgi:hypothetical protein